MLSAEKRNFWILLTMMAIFLTATQWLERPTKRHYTQFNRNSKSCQNKQLRKKRKRHKETEVVVYDVHSRNFKRPKGCKDNRYTR